LASVFDAPIERAVLACGAPEAVQALEPAQRAAFTTDARAVAAGAIPRQVWTGELAAALPEEAARAGRVDAALGWGGLIAMVLAAVIGAGVVWRRIRPEARARNRVEAVVGAALFACSAVAILTTIGIVASLVFESFRFFQAVPVTEFLFGTQWSPQIAIRADQVGSTGAF